ncbi:MAG: hypothetical protein ABIE68_00860 [bacterium]
MRGLFLALGIVGAVSLIIVGVCSISWWYDFHSEIGDHLKNAGDAPNLEMANEFLSAAIEKMEEQGLTSGNSAFFFNKLKVTDVGIWYRKINEANETVSDLLARIVEDPESVSQLVRDNALMKIREVVLDEGKSGTEVTLPAHIVWFPSEVGILLWWWISFIIAAIGWVSFFITSDY